MLSYNLNPHLSLTSLVLTYLMHIQTLFLLIIIFNFSYHLYTYLVVAILLYSRYGTIFIWNTCWCCWSTTSTSRNERMKLRNIQKFPIIIIDMYWNTCWCCWRPGRNGDMYWATFVTVFPLTMDVVTIIIQFCWAPISMTIWSCTTIISLAVIFPREYTSRACWNLKRIQMNLKIRR